MSRCKSGNTASPSGVYHSSSRLSLHYLLRWFNVVITEDIGFLTIAFYTLLLMIIGLLYFYLLFQIRVEVVLSMIRRVCFELNTSLCLAIDIFDNVLSYHAF